MYCSRYVKVTLILSWYMKKLTEILNCNSLLEHFLLHQDTISTLSYSSNHLTFFLANNMPLLTLSAQVLQESVLDMLPFFFCQGLRGVFLLS